MAQTSTNSKLFRLIGISTFSVLTIAAVFYFQNNKKALQASVGGSEKVALSSFPIIEPTMKYGFALDTFQVEEGIFQQGQFLADILLKHKVNYLTIEQLAINADSVFKITNFRIDKPYTILSRDTTQGADYFVYEPNDYEYVVFELKNDLQVTKAERPVEKRTQAAGGTIESNLWNAMVGMGASWDLAAKMEDALQWSLSFYHLQEGDEFRLVYDEDYIDDKRVGAGMVHAAQYKTADTTFYAIFYESEKDKTLTGYYDLEGRPMNKGFLKSPVKFSRISSYYNLNRFHPILKRRRPHFGTDYAAPHGTPIRAVGSGVVVRASYTKGNGNYVKIKHDDTYQTQYLHMSGFAKGIKVGSQVAQGQTIGYVGSTGLATGPHVCFRFWKNGKQVNHLNMNFPPAAPLPQEDLPGFFEKRDQLLAQLQGVEIQEIKKEEETKQITMR